MRSVFVLFANWRDEPHIRWYVKVFKSYDTALQFSIDNGFKDLEFNIEEVNFE